MRLNPYIEIIAEAVYRKETQIKIESHFDWDIAKDAMEFMRARSFDKSFKLQGNFIYIKYHERKD